MKKSVLGAGIAVAVAAAAALAVVGPFDAPGTHAASALAFEAKFESASDFYGRFDMGYSGIGPFESLPVAIKGDHDLNCGGPTTQRDVNFGGTTANVDYSQLFWFCAPGGDPTKGHVMTAVDTHGYNIAWFSPKPAFTAISKVCWDINETTVSARKWTQVLFVGDADAHRYPTGMSLPGDTVTYPRGTGGFDLGYTSPEFRQGQPNAQFFPEGGTLAGLKDGFGIFDWFQNQDTWTAQGVGWPGLLPQGLPGGLPITDKAARYKHCVENQPNNTILVTMDSPIGQLTRTLPGQIPQDARRVVFEDDNYNPSKGDFYDPNVLTWHWDNIQVFTDDGTGPAPTTVATTAAPTTVATTVAPTTVATTAAPTTVATTVAPTTVATTAAPTSVAPTTAAPTTVGPIDLTAPTTVATTAAPTTVAPTTVATTAAPTTVAPTTVATTAAPTTVATTVAPTTVATTVAPTTTVATTAAPTTVATTVAPTTAAPTTVATTVAPTTAAPTTVATTVAPTTVATTVAPTTAAPTTVATTAAPTTIATTVAPTTAAPTTAAALGAPTGDTTPPVITIMGGPPATTTDRDAVITFSANDGTQEFAAGGGVTFTGKLDGGAVLPVTSPVRIAGLPLGDHVLVIKATDQAGNVGSAFVTWKVIPMPSDLTARGSSAGGSSARAIIAAHKSALEAAIKGGGLRPPFRLVLPRTRVADEVVVRTAVPPPAQEVLAETGARTTENVVLGLTLIGLGLVLAGVASGFRRRTS